MADLVEGRARCGPPVVVHPHTTLDEAVGQLTTARRSSVLVVEDADRPLGRILADDLLPERGHPHTRRPSQ
ncbi:hypothetical protein DMH15_01090 [Streptomyces sp. WAC 06725]|uniref:CBS domain-containing protein n=1 Tax=Streptomyces sp. WAC 06725 TaxID=2203209 RepID=UPI000F735E68|nr:CBS domain-containing protein [Streptomyces sp. WAC 06725]RSO50548.1 hypothetical protein DMH15_01090 [Streptomyces sp. WAC 06725]